MAFIVIEGKDIGDVRLFTMSTCAWCDKMKALLSANGIRYSCIDMDRVDPEEQKQTTEYLDSIYPKWGFPCLLFDNRVLIVGYQEKEIAETLGLRVLSQQESESVQEPLRDEVTKAIDRLQRFSEKKRASLNPDRSITVKLVSGLLENQNRYGYWACPCRLAAGKKDLDRDIICPCDYWEQDVAEFGACYCGLFVSEKVATGEMRQLTVPERRPTKTE